MNPGFSTLAWELKATVDVLLEGVCTWLLYTHLDTVGKEAGCEGHDHVGEGDSVHLATIIHPP